MDRLLVKRQHTVDRKDVFSLDDVAEGRRVSWLWPLITPRRLLIG